MVFGPKVPQFCSLLPSWYAFWVSLWAFVFSFLGKLLLFIIFYWHWQHFCICTYNFCQCYWYQKHEIFYRQSVGLPQTSSGIHLSGLQDSNQQERLRFFVSLGNFFFPEKTCCKINSLTCGPDDNNLFKKYECESTKLSIRSKRDNYQVCWS